MYNDNGLVILHKFNNKKREVLYVITPLGVNGNNAYETYLSESGIIILSEIDYNEAVN